MLNTQSAHADKSRWRWPICGVASLAVMMAAIWTLGIAAGGSMG